MVIYICIYTGAGLWKSVCVRVCVCQFVKNLELALKAYSFLLLFVCAHTLAHMCASKSVSLQLSIRYTHKIYVYVDFLAIHRERQLGPAGELKQSMYVKHLIGPNQVHIVVTSLRPSDRALYRTECNPIFFHCIVSMETEQSCHSFAGFIKNSSPFWMLNPKVLFCVSPTRRMAFWAF